MKNKRVFHKIVFVFPVIFLLIAIIAYFIVIPVNYEYYVSVRNWIFMDREELAGLLYASNVRFFEISEVIGIQIFWRIWALFFMVSLFFVGRELNGKGEPDARSALLVKKEPYRLIQEMNIILKQKSRVFDNKKMAHLLYAIKCLEEKLSVESDFGYGNQEVTNCENEVAGCLQILLSEVSNMEMRENVDVSILLDMVDNINFLLRQRRELERR